MLVAFLKGALVAALSTLGGLVAAEIALRILAPDILRPPAEKGFFEYKTDGRALGLVPNYAGNQTRKEFSTVLRTNDIGLRDHRSLAEIVRAPGLRIMCMGDSFTFGWGVDWEQTWCQRLGQYLRNERQIDTTTVSTGYDNGLSPVQYAFSLDNYLSRLKPDLVIASLFMENDVKEAGYIEADGTKGQRLRELSLGDGYLVTEAGAQRGKLYLFAYQASYLVRLVARAATMISTTILQSNGATIEVSNDKTPYFFLSGVPKPDDASYAATLAALVRMRDTLAGKGIRFLVMVIPSNFQVSAHYFGPMAENFGFSPATLATVMASGQPQAFLADYFARNGIEFVDLLPAFRQIDRPGNRLYFDIDAHFSVKGNDEAARQIAEALARKGFLGRPGQPRN